MESRGDPNKEFGNPLTSSAGGTSPAVTVGETVTDEATGATHPGTWRRRRFRVAAARCVRPLGSRLTLTSFPPPPGASRRHLAALKFAGAPRRGSRDASPAPATGAKRWVAGSRERAPGRPVSAFGQRRGAVRSPGVQARPRRGNGTRLRVLGKRDPTGRHPRPRRDTFLRDPCLAHGGTPGPAKPPCTPSASGPGEAPTWHPERNGTPTPASASSILPKAAGVPEPAAAGEAPNAPCAATSGSLAPGEPRGEGREVRADGARLPGKGWRPAGGSGEARGAAPGAPGGSLRPLRSALVGAKGGGGGSRADVTAGRARPSGRRWEPLRAPIAARGREPSRPRCRARLPHSRPCARAGWGAWRATRAGPEPGDSPDRGPPSRRHCSRPTPAVASWDPGPLPDPEAQRELFFGQWKPEVISEETAAAPPIRQDPADRTPQIPVECPTPGKGILLSARKMLAVWTTGDGHHTGTEIQKWSSLDATPSRLREVPETWALHLQPC
ncbi:skin secretory protein xP2-like [Cavia porcellus]|uniref:skin secretory protein xP2-like n=1 Tax=Cavia porcellus TaxID=10141 RepID=UPI002FE14AF8